MHFFLELFFPVVGSGPLYLKFRNKSLCIYSPLPYMLQLNFTSLLSFHVKYINLIVIICNYASPVCRTHTRSLKTT